MHRIQKLKIKNENNKATSKTHQNKNGIGSEVKIATMNVNTLRTCESLNILLRNLARNNIDVACIQETHNGEHMLGNTTTITYSMEEQRKQNRKNKWKQQ